MPLLIALYPDESRAGQAEQSFLRNYLKDAPGLLARMPDGLWTGCRREGNRLSIVFNAPAEAAARSYLDIIGSGKPPEK